MLFVSTTRTFIRYSSGGGILPLSVSALVLKHALSYEGLVLIQNVQLEAGQARCIEACQGDFQTFGALCKLGTSLSFATMVRGQNRPGLL